MPILPCLPQREACHTATLRPPTDVLLTTTPSFPVARLAATLSSTSSKPLHSHSHTWRNLASNPDNLNPKTRTFMPIWTSTTVKNEHFLQAARHFTPNDNSCASTLATEQLVPLYFRNATEFYKHRAYITKELLLYAKREQQLFYGTYNQSTVLESDWHSF